MIDNSGYIFKGIMLTICGIIIAFFPGVITSPYLMTGASDARYMSRVSDCCIRFAPFKVDDEQLASIHGINESVDLSCLEPAVEFYKYIIREVG